MSRDLSVKSTPETTVFSVELETEIAIDLHEMATKRGVSVSKFVEVMTRSFTAKTTVFGLRDIIKFGKYSGVITEELIRVDPSYCRWALGNTERFDLTEEAMDLLDEIDPPKKKKRGSKGPELVI